MSSKAQAVIEEFNSLPQVEQLAVYEAIARKVTPVDYGPLSDNDLTAIAGETFALLDQEESRCRFAVRFEKDFRHLANDQKELAAENSTPGASEMHPHGNEFVEHRG